LNSANEDALAEEEIDPEPGEEQTLTGSSENVLESTICIHDASPDIHWGIQEWLRKICQCSSMKA
jgi:hypothetical protein